MKVWRWRIESLKPLRSRERFGYLIGAPLRVLKVRPESRQQFVVSFKVNGVSVEAKGARLRFGDQVEVKIDHDNNGPVVCLLDVECEHAPFSSDCIELSRRN